MAFCTKCGDEHQAKFCPKCGQPVSGKQDQVPKQREETTKHKDKTENPKGNPLKKWLVAMLFILIAGGVGGYVYAGQYFSYERAVDQLISAIEEENADQIRSMAESSMEESITEEGMAYFMAIMNEQERLDAFRVDMLANLSGEQADVSDYPAVLEQSGSVWGIFDDYTLKFESYTIEIRHVVPDSGVTVHYNGDEVGVFEDGNNRLTIERVFPAGDFITIDYAGGYGEAEEQIAVEELGDLFTDRLLSYTWDFEGSYIDIFANRSDSYLMVNGEETGDAIGSGMTLGPVNFNEIEFIQAYTQGQFDRLISEEKAVKPGDSRYELVFGEETVEKIEAEDLFSSINQHVTDWVDAYRDQDPGKFSMLTDDFAEMYLTRTRGNFDEQRSQGWRYQGYADRVDYDVASVRILNDQADYLEVSIDVRLNFQSSFYAVGSNPSDTPLTRSTSEWTYYLLYDIDSGMWLLNGQEELDNWRPEEEHRYEL